jgi:hypothetical protein
MTLATLQAPAHRAWQDDQHHTADDVLKRVKIERAMYSLGDGRNQSK